MKHIFCMAWLLVALALVQSGAAQDNEVLKSMDEALKAAQSFQMGVNPDPLHEIERIVFHLPPDSELRGALEQKLLEALQSDASLDTKRVLCRQLSVIGTANSVPTLAELLSDPELAHIARYALGRLEAPEATTALLQALDKTSGDLQAGIIDTLGNRQCTAAREKLVELLGSGDRNVVRAAATSLGRLGGSDALAALQAAAANADAALRVDIDNALLNAAEGLAREGKTEEAAALYDEFYQKAASQQIRFAGLRGLVATQSAQAVQLLTEAMRADDVALRRYAISLSDQAPGQEATEMLAGSLDSLPVEDRVLLLRALGARGDAAAAEAIVAAAKDEDAEVRVTALETLGQLGDASIAVTLAEAAAAGDDRERRVARASLMALTAQDTNAKLLQFLKNADPGTQVELIHALAARGADAAVDTLLPYVTESEANVRRAAIEAMGVLANEPQLDALIKTAASSESPDDSETLVEAIGRIFKRVDDRQKCAAAVQTEMAKAPAASRPLLVRLLGKAGAVEGLVTIRRSLDDSQSAMRQAAVDALAEWPDAVVAPDLLKLLTDRRFADSQPTVLTGYLRLAAQSEDPTTMYVRALDQVRAANAKKAILEGIGLSSETPQALDVVFKYLDDPALQAAAGIATVRIAFRQRQRDESRTRDALKQVLAKVDHPDVQKRAQELLNELDQYEDHILTWVTAGPFQESGQDGGAIYRTPFPPETDPDGTDWKPLTKGIGSWDVNLEATYGGLDFVAAYLRTRVWSDVEQDIQLEMGSDDGIKAWLNGQLLYDQWGEGSASPRQKLVKAKLQQGWNDLMLKVVDQQGGWVGACRIRKPDGTALTGLKYEAR